MSLEYFTYCPPSGIRHRVTEDDIYEGYFIPKGTTIISNIWYVFQDTSPIMMWCSRYILRAITHDAEVYPDPYIFDPERHLGGKAQLDPMKIVFGYVNLLFLYHDMNF
jgi:cytochrome P450